MRGQHACQVAQASYLSCGSQGYCLLRSCGFLFPTERTLQRHLANFKFRPGLLQDILEPLRMKVNLRKPDERHATLMIDEMQLAPGLVYDHSCRCILGSPTLPLCDGSLPEDTLPTHDLVFLLGDCPRDGNKLLLIF